MVGRVALRACEATDFIDPVGGGSATWRKLGVGNAFDLVNGLDLQKNCKLQIWRLAESDCTLEEFIPAMVQVESPSQPVTFWSQEVRKADPPPLAGDDVAEPGADAGDSGTDCKRFWRSMIHDPLLKCEISGIAGQFHSDTFGELVAGESYIGVEVDCSCLGSWLLSRRFTIWSRRSAVAPQLSRCIGSVPPCL